jgi:UDP-2-acetamido-3-amino-2,3-dideoxy-glucuronate N-acetyltransferase
MSKKRNIAVVGTGFWGKNLVRNYQTLGVLRAVCDTDPARLEALAGQAPDVLLTNDLEQVLADPAVEGVVIALPAALHHEYGRRALQAGKDVYVEKPLALHLAHARELLALARERKRILMVGHLLQYHPAFVELKRLVHTGELGRIQYIYSNRLSLGKIRREESSLWSFAPHDLSMILSLTNEIPDEVIAVGGNYLHKSIADVTTTHLSFPGGVKAHIFVSWLHPFKEQKLVIVAEKKMAVFEDTQPWDKKIALYSHSIRWQMGAPIPEKAEPTYVPVPAAEPLTAECLHFLECIETRRAPLTDGAEGYRVLEVLDRAQRSLERGAAAAPVPPPPPGPAEDRGVFVHASAYVDEPCSIGAGTKIWHFCHVQPGARIGAGCSLGQNVNIGNDVVVGDNVKIQNNVSVYTGTVIEDDVFLGPSCVLTNVSNPRAQVNRRRLYERTLLRRGATVGANATIVCGVTVGRYAFVAAGAVVTKDVPDYALVAGTPARRIGWMSRQGHRLGPPAADGTMTCPESGYRYREEAPGRLRCLDLDEEAPLPAALREGKGSYDDWKDVARQRSEREPR